MDVELPQKDKEYIIEKAVEGWEPELIGYGLRNEQGSPIRDETVEEFLGQESTQGSIELEKELIEKRAEVSREDLIRELKEQIDHIKTQRQRLEGEHDDISNDATKNLLNAVRDLADLIDVLESKDGGSANNVININSLEQNFEITSMVQHLPAEDKQSVVEQLEDDPEIEDYAIKKVEA